MTSIRLFPKLLLPPLLAAGAFALLNFIFRSRKSRAGENLEIVY